MEKGKIFGHPGLVLRGPETHAPDFVMFDMNGQVLHVDTRPFTREVRRQAGMAYEDGIGGFRLVLRDGRAYPICTIEYGAYRERNGSPSKYDGWIATMANVAVVVVYAIRRRDDSSLELLIGQIRNLRRTSTDPNDPAQEAPRGRIEKGETPGAAGERELLEEVGLEREVKLLPGQSVNMNNAWLSHPSLNDGSPGGFFFARCEVGLDCLEPVPGSPGRWRFDEFAREAHAAKRRLEDFEKDIGPMTFKSYKDVISGGDGPTIIAAARLRQWLEEEGDHIFDVPGMRTRI